MISDEPDEDADELDDEKMLETYIERRQRSCIDVVADLPDWPFAQSPAQGGGLQIDSTTVAWFKANHAEWQREIASVLRGWIVAQTRAKREVSHLADDAAHISAYDVVVAVPGATTSYGS